MSFLNRLQMGYEFFTNKTRTSAYPVMVSVEPTNRCNLTCVMCPTNAPDSPDNRDRGDMTMDTYLRILSELDLKKVDTIGLIGGGDPLLGKNTLDMIKENKKRGIKTTLFTNAVALSYSMADKLLDLDIETIHFSIDGANKSTYEDIRLGGKFENVVNNVLRFCEKKVALNNKTKVFVQLIISEKTVLEVDQFYEFWSNVPGISKVRFKEELDHLFEKKNHTDNKRKKCFIPWYFGHFRWNGDVYFCYQDWMCTMAPANLHENSFHEIINSPKMQEIRTHMANDEIDKIDLCRECTIPQPTLSQILALLLLPEPISRWLGSTYERINAKKLKSLYLKLENESKMTGCGK